MFSNVFLKIAPFIRQCRKLATNDNTTWRMRVARWISTATCARAHAHDHAPGHARTHPRAHTHSEKCKILIAFSRQQWFRERASLLHDTYIASPVTFTHC